MVEGKNCPIICHQCPNLKREAHAKIEEEEEEKEEEEAKKLVRKVSRRVDDDTQWFARRFARRFARSFARGSPGVRPGFARRLPAVSTGFLATGFFFSFSILLLQPNDRCCSIVNSLLRLHSITNR